jgi:hypothetical protein
VILASLAEWVLLAADQPPTPTPTPAPAAAREWWWTLADYGIRAAGAIGLPAALTWFFVDRRRTRAAATVDERSVNANVAKNDASAYEAHVLAVEKGLTLERASFDRQIARLDGELTDLEARHARRVQELVADSVAKDMLAADLRAQVATLKAELKQHRAAARRSGGEGVA